MADFDFGSLGIGLKCVLMIDYQLVVGVQLDYAAPIQLLENSGRRCLKKHMQS